MSILSKQSTNFKFSVVIWMKNRQTAEPIYKTSIKGIISQYFIISSQLIWVREILSHTGHGKIISLLWLRNGEKYHIIDSQLGVASVHILYCLKEVYIQLCNADNNSAQHNTCLPQGTSEDKDSVIENGIPASYRTHFQHQNTG